MKNEILNIYIANLGKYNEGELVGGWINLPVEEEELRTFLKETVGINGRYEEWAIHDYENFGFFGKIDEYDDIFALNEKAQEIADMNDYDLRKLQAAIEVWGDDALEWDMDDLILYDGVENEADLGHYIVEELAYYNVPDELSSFIDYEKLGADFANNRVDGGFTTYGFIEYIG